jgi:hypothetical protein
MIVADLDLTEEPLSSETVDVQVLDIGADAVADVILGVVQLGIEDTVAADDADPRARPARRRSLLIQRGSRIAFVDEVGRAGRKRQNSDRQGDQRTCEKPVHCDKLSSGFRFSCARHDTGSLPPS